MHSIDQDRRRAELADTVWALIRRDGLAGASVRAVAAAAGRSSGSVRHTFPTQARLHAFAMETLADRIAARVATHRDIEDPAARAVAMVCELMPLTDDSENELRAWLEFVAASHVDPQLATIAEGTLVATREFLTRVVSDLVDQGVVAADTDLGRSVAELNALVDGLTVQLVHSPVLIDRNAARSLVAYRLTHPVTIGDQP